MEVFITILEDLWEGLLAPFYYFIDPSKRLNLIYLFSSTLLAYYVYKKAKTTIPFYRYLFNKKVWLSKSAFIDYKYLFFNGIIKILLIAPIFVAWRYVGVETNDFLEETFNASSVSLSKNQVIIFYSLSLVIAYDLVFYLWHLAMHKSPFLWEFHKIHHSATSLNPITQYRLHPVELIANNAALFLVSALLKGVFDYFYQGSIELVTYAEVNIFAMLFLFWGANLRHSHVKLKYFSRLEKIFISPRQHQIHHSDNPLHFNKNMGAKLAVWDRIFGTLLRSKDAEKIKFGLGKSEVKDYNTFFKTLYIPFKNITKYIIGLFSSSKR